VQTGKPELIVDAKAILGEGPSWDAEQRLLYWVDILGRKIHIHDPAADTNRVLALDQYVGAVVPRENGGLVLALQHGFHIMDTEGGIQKIADPEAHLPDNRFNDGKCDAAGRFWAGTMSLIDEELQGGALYKLDKGFRVEKMLDDVNVSNGLGWSPDGETMYYIDSPKRTIFAFDFNVETGEIANRRAAVSVPAEEGFPDGMTVDEEGMLWVAHWEGWQLARWNPLTGEKTGSVPFPVSKVTSCVFAGEHLDELYVTSARVGLSQAESAAQPFAGGLFRVKLGIKGAPTYKYGG
jgi:sugar lactone lactonase YvrE